MVVEIIGECTLYLADCVDQIPNLSGVQAVITDPPYGINFKYKSHVDSPDGYGNWIFSVMQLCESVSEPNSPFFVWQSTKNMNHFNEWFLRDFRILIVAKNFTQIRPTAMQYTYDPVIAWWTESDEKPWTAGSHNKDFFVSNTAPVVASPENIERKHPCPRALDCVSYVIEQWVKPQTTVLDPFMGSGTTGVACANLNRKFIGIEKEPEYFDIACERIFKAQQQGNLFAGNF